MFHHVPTLAYAEAIKNPLALVPEPPFHCPLSRPRLLGLLPLNEEETTCKKNKKIKENKSNKMKQVSYATYLSEFILTVGQTQTPS